MFAKFKNASGIFAYIQYACTQDTSIKKLKILKKNRFIFLFFPKGKICILHLSYIYAFIIFWDSTLYV